MVRRGSVELLFIVAVVPLFIFAQEERWVYRYSGVVGWRDDCANSIVFDADSNIYAAGYSWYNETGTDFTVISLTCEGAERWIYTYNGLGDRGDAARTIVYGDDDNIYVGGFSTGSDTTRDFTIISLTNSGTERWVYQYNGPGNGPDDVYDVVYGTDGNVYAVGSSWGSNANVDFTVVSVTASGAERWVYTCNGPGNYADCARSVVYGADGNIYAVGESYGSDTNDDFTVISLTTSGAERWIYRYNGPGNWADYANTVVCGADSNIYVAGSSAGYFGFDITVICLTNMGNENWIYRHPENYFDDFGYAGVLGSDGNIYVAGAYGSDVPDFMVVSLTDSGIPRWEYIYYTPTFIFEAAVSIVYGYDGNTYAAGHVAGNSGMDVDFAVVSLDSFGVKRWIYQYDRCGEYDYALAICHGVDNNIYAVGMTTDSITGGDFTVISLAPGSGIHECGQDSVMRNNCLQTTPSPFRNQVNVEWHMRDELAMKGILSLCIYDITGKLVKQFNLTAHTPSDRVIWDGKDNFGSELPGGVYFVRLEAPGGSVTRKIVKLK